MYKHACEKRNEWRSKTERNIYIYITMLYI